MVRKSVAVARTAPHEVRIIGGQWKRTRLPVADRPGLRPTPDRVRETLFNWLGQDLTGWRCVDAFAGTGALGLEALSRGAAHATFIEQDRVALAILRANIAACRAEGAARVIGGDATRPPPAALPCGLVFLDPPYGKELVAKAVAALSAAGWIAPDALLIAETGREEALELNGFEKVALREHGAAALHCFRGQGGAAPLDPPPGG